MTMTAIQAIEEQAVQAPVSKSTAAAMPVVPAVARDAEASETLMRTLRHFYLGDPSAKGELKAVGGDFLPVLLNSFRDVSKVRHDYPLFLFPAESADGSPLAKPLSRFLLDAVEGFAPGPDSARILRDNLPWVERELNRKLQGQEAPVEAAPLISDAADALLKHLDLPAEHGERLQADLEKLTASVEAGSQLLGYSRYAAIHLLIHVVCSRAVPRRALFHNELKQLIHDLGALLDVEREKSAAAKAPETMRQRVGTASTYFDPNALSAMMDHSTGSMSMSPERLQRVEKVLKVLQGYQDEPVLVRFVHVGKLADGWLDATADFEAVTDADPCTAATTIFDREADKLAKVFAAMRIARLEIAGKYDARIHDPWFSNFNWEGFSQEELLLVPAVIALESASRIAGEGMSSFSRLLSSGRPVQILVRVQSHNNPGALSDEDPFQRYRVELGYIGISHRQAIVAQSSASRYEHLLDQYALALDGTRTSLHLISTGIQLAGESVLDPWFVASAALEGRAHPFFHVNPEAGDEAAVRMDFSGNPQPELDWPLHSFRYQDEYGEVIDEELPFTFADYAFLVPRLRDHFALIPHECESPDLRPVAECLALPRDAADRCVPFIWAVDGEGALQRLVISRALVIACQDRRNYWRALQEMAGVRSRYIDLAAQRAKEEAQATAAAEIERLNAEHAAEVDRIRAETAGEVLGRLADALVGLDFTAAPVAATRAAPASAPAVPESEAAPEPKVAVAEVAPEPEEEEVSFDDPWIETILCTSCNDCINLNPLMFVYDDNKQALIGDPNAGTYAQLVASAEFCPANCIHPGKPLNPNEPGLEELIKRAEAYN